MERYCSGRLSYKDSKMTVCPTVLQDAQFMVKNDLESYDLTKNNEKQLHEQFSHTKETITTGNEKERYHMRYRGLERAHGF